jgi:hypothetical protein
VIVSLARQVFFEEKTKTMKKIILVYGLIAGTIVGAMLMITMPLYENGVLKIDNGEWLGYTTMVVALSLVFFGVKSYRDHHLKGSITFVNGLKVGLLITLVASILYIASWEFTYRTMKGDIIQLMSDKSHEKMKAKGASPEEMMEAKKKMDDFAVMYRNPIIRWAFTFIEIAPVGILISLISAGLLRKKEFLPMAEDNPVSTNN